jgi:crossover junction endodeoxyribonuclease RuvC
MKQPQRILGLDPGLRNTGWGIIDSIDNRIAYVGCGVIKSDQSDELSDRLCTLFHGIQKIITQFSPQEAGVEETFVNKNAASSLKLGSARGVVLLAPAWAGLVVKEYTANQVKKSVVGTGHATKDQIIAMVKRFLPRAEIKSADAADALAIAICHSHYSSTLRKYGS